MSVIYEKRVHALEKDVADLKDGFGYLYDLIQGIKKKPTQVTPEKENKEPACNNANWCGIACGCQPKSNLAPGISCHPGRNCSDWPNCEFCGPARL